MALENVKTAGRTLDIFEAFARAGRPLSLTELAQIIGSPASSTHALVKTLRARGYIYAFEDRKLIYATKRISTIAQLIEKNDPIVEIAQPEMRRLLGESDETVILGKRQGSSITYLEVLESTQSIRYSAQPGDTKPLHSSAIGKATLSLLPDQEIKKLLKKAGLKQMTDATIVDSDALIADIRACQKRNVFVTRGENVADVMGISVNVQIGNEALSIAIAGPTVRLMDKETEYSELLTSSVINFQKLEKVIGFG